MHAKIDNHCIELHHNEDTKNIVIYYNYNNNTSCATLIYLNDKKQFLYNYDRILTKRQQQLLLKLIKKYNDIILKNLFYKMELDKKMLWDDEDFKKWYNLVELYKVNI
jgi:hypothetical protein